MSEESQTESNQLQSTTNSDADDKSSTKDFNEYQQMICSIIPPLCNDFHKGQAGRIGVIGGSKEYTGAPYFTGISAMKTGADLSYIFCSADSSSVIKSYSPELVVYPIIDQQNFIEEFNAVLPKLHVLVIGPGLGRNDQILSNIGSVIQQVKEQNIPIVLDADALYFVSKCPEIVRSYTSAILTPNIREFEILFNSVFRTEYKNIGNDCQKAVELLAKTLGNITILRKGPEDIISNGEYTYVSNEPGSPRRCGGQGDLLAGAIATFSYWSHKAFKSNELVKSNSNCLKISQNYTPTILACLAASMLTRRCARFAFKKYSRSTTTSNIIQEIKNSFTSLYPID